MQLLGFGLVEEVGSLFERTAQAGYLLPVWGRRGKRLNTAQEDLKSINSYNMGVEE